MDRTPTDGTLYHAATAMTLAAVVMTQVGTSSPRGRRANRRSARGFRNRLLWAGSPRRSPARLIVYVPALQGVFGTAAIPLSGWLFLLPWAPALLLADEVRKAVVRRKHRIQRNGVYREIIVAGCGRVGSGLARALSLRHHAVTVVDVDPDAFQRLGKHFPGARSRKRRGPGNTRFRRCGARRRGGGRNRKRRGERRLRPHRPSHVPRAEGRGPAARPSKGEEYLKHGIQTVTPVTWGSTGWPTSSAIPTSTR